MAQSRAEAERLMEQQHFPVDYESPQDRGLADPDEEYEDEELEDCPACSAIRSINGSGCSHCGWRSD